MILTLIYQTTNAVAPSTQHGKLNDLQATCLGLNNMLDSAQLVDERGNVLAEGAEDILMFEGLSNTADPGVAPIGSFAWALLRMQDGAQVAREDWSTMGADLTVGIVEPSEEGPVTEPFFAMYCGKDVTVWQPSASDLMAEDWEEHDS